MTVKVAVYILISVLIFGIQCASVGTQDNLKGNTLSGESSIAAESKDRIDNWKTYETFFTLTKNEDCIKIEITSEMFDEIADKKAILKTYFIVEKEVDVSKFSKDNKILFSEISKNYDYNWTVKQYIEICTSGSDPIKRLNNIGRFRIRFTTFKENNFKYYIKIYSKNLINMGS